MPRIARSFAYAIAAVVLMAAGLAAAGDPQVYVDRRTGLAIQGYDPVAYFTEGEARKGDPAHALEWGGGTWHFTSAANRDAFAADPEAYAPKYGGYCAYAVAKGSARVADPRVWSIVDGELYLNLSPNVRKVWQEDLRANIALADRIWSPALIEQGRSGFRPSTAGDR